VFYYMGLCYHSLKDPGHAQQLYQRVLSNSNISPRLRQNAETGLRSLGSSAAPPAASSGGGGGMGGPLPKVIDFSATWCGPCKRIAPLVDQLEREYHGRVDFQKVDIDQNRQLAGRYKIRAVPTFVFFDANGRVVNRIEGASPQELREDLEKLVQ
jgi:thioredoxin 1